MSASGNRRKDELLGEPHGTANGRLRKMVLFKYVRLAGHDVCYRCRERIASVDDVSMEHSESWQLSADPRSAFFDIEKIAFSHLSCNVKASVRRTLTFESEEARIAHKRFVSRSKARRLYTPEKRRAKYERSLLMRRRSTAGH